MLRRWVRFTTLVRTLTTLGTLKLSGTAWSRLKPLAMLAYLAVEGRTPRRRVQELFWPGARQASNSLRVALHMLRELAPELVVGSDVLEASVRCDAAALLAESDSAAAFALYTGPFLHGVALPGISDELDEWIVETGERIAAAAQQAGLLAAEASHSPAQRARLAEVAYRLAPAPPLMPTDLRRLSELLSPGSAAERELQAELASFGAQVAASARLPPAGLLGRGRELSELLALLGPARTRLTEVTGPGGVGKTTLVDAALREHAALSGVRVASVDAEPFVQSAEVAAQLAAALELPLNDLGDVWLALSAALDDQPTVVALHGVEHLPPLSAAAQTLLERCPALQLVLTSRVRMTGGAHLHLDGLGLPPGGGDTALIRSSPAVQLLVREAGRLGVLLSVHGADAPLLASVARRLDGHPLALRLAASLSVWLPLPALHERLLQDLARPQTGEWNDLRALFDRSWSLLKPPEQRALSQLVVFADFTAEDALAAVGVGSALLDRLEAHSLLRRREGRWQVLPVLAPLVPTTGLSDAGLSEARAAHAAYYQGLLTGLAPEDPRLAAERRNITSAVEYAVTSGAAQPELTDALLGVYDRSGQLSLGSAVFVRLSELSATSNCSAAVRASALIGQAWLAYRSSRPRDAERLARRLLDDPAMSGPQVRMKALNVRASALSSLGQPLDALPVLREAVELARRTGDRAREARYLENMGTLASETGDYAQGEQLLRRAIALHRADGNEMPVLFGRLQLLNMRVDQRFAPSTWQIGPLLDEARVLDGAFELVGAVQPACLAQILQARLLLQTAPAEALGAAQRGAERCRQHGFEAFEAAATLVSAEALYMLGRTPEARRALIRALKVNLGSGDVPGMIEGWLVVAADLQDLQPVLALELLDAAAYDRRSDASQRARAVQLGAAPQEPAGPSPLRYDAARLTTSVLVALEH